MFINELILQDNILLLGKSGRPFSFKSKRYFSFDIVLLRLFVVLVLFVFVFSSLKSNLLSSSSSLFSSSTSSISSISISSSVSVFDLLFSLLVSFIPDEFFISSSSSINFQKYFLFKPK